MQHIYVNLYFVYYVYTGIYGESTMINFNNAYVTSSNVQILHYEDVAWEMYFCTSATHV